MTVRVVTVSSLLFGGIAMHLASAWLRRHGVPIPHAHFPPSLWQVAVVVVIVFFTVFLVVELILLAKAIATVDKPWLHERYKTLMLHWPYALLMLHTVFKTAEGPRAFFGPDERGDADPAAVGSLREKNRRTAPTTLPGPVKAVPATEQPNPVTGEQYRSALAMVIERIDLLTTDRAVLDLLLEQYRSLEPAADAPPPVDRGQMPVKLPKARSSNRWADDDADAYADRDRDWPEEP